MPIVIEDGTGLADAEAYASIAVADAYLASVGNTEWVGLTAEAKEAALEAKEAALRRATSWLDGKYRSFFNGAKVNGRNQALEWPRTNATDAAGAAVTGVPIEMVRANAVAASREAVTAGALTPDTDRSVQVKRQKVDVLEVEYFEGAEATIGGVTVTEIDNLLSGLLSVAALTSGTSSTTVTTLLRN